MNRRSRLIGVALIVAMMSSTAASGNASSSNPNSNANPRCPFGPGVARWAIKTSVPPGALSETPIPLDLNALIHAPDLEVSPQTVASAHARVLSLSTSSTPTAFVALLKWSRPAVPFELRLPPITPQILKKAKRYAVAARADGESAPSTFDAILTAQLDDERIPDPVTIGNVTAREGQTVTTSGTVVASTCEKDDGDFHIDLGNDNGEGCAVVEVPNPSYISSKDLGSSIDAAEGVAKSLNAGDRITVTGQLFYDTAHGGGADPGGGRGKGRCAQSLWEIHPVFRIETT